MPAFENMSSSTAKLKADANRERGRAQAVEHVGVASRLSYLLSFDFVVPVGCRFVFRPRLSRLDLAVASTGESFPSPCLLLITTLAGIMPVPDRRRALATLFLTRRRPRHNSLPRSALILDLPHHRSRNLYPPPAHLEPHILASYSSNAGGNRRDRSARRGVAIA